MAVAEHGARGWPSRSGSAWYPARRPRWVGALLVRLRYGASGFRRDTAVEPDHKVAYVIEAPPVFFGREPLQVALTLMLAGRHRRTGVCRARGRDAPRGTTSARFPAAERHPESSGAEAS